MGKWIKGEVLARRWRGELEQFEIFDYLASGALQPYSSITGKKHKWLDFDRDDIFVVFNKWDYFKNHLFLKADIEKFEQQHGIKTANQSNITVSFENTRVLFPYELTTSLAAPTKKAAPVAEPETSKTTVNFIKRKGDLWHIGFEGQSVIIRHLNGFLYIRSLLETPGKAHSSINLYRTANPSDPALMDSNQASAEGLNINAKTKIVHEGLPATKKALMEKCRELNVDLENADSDLERNQIEAEIDMILASIKSEDKLPDTLNQKAQNNVKKSINRAIKAIAGAGMKSLADHLEHDIKPDSQYGYIYTGSFWQPS